MASRPNLTVQQLEYLVAVADAPTWADAAADVGVSPSALSQGLAELERRVGMPLFERQGRRRLVAPSAVPVVAHARVVLARTSDLDFDTIQWVIFETPDRAKNQGIGFFGFLLRSRCWTHSDGSSKTKQQRNQEQSASNAGKQR